MLPRNRVLVRLPILLMMVSLYLFGCQPDEQSLCPVTKPILAKPPADAAVGGTPTEGYYYINQDRSIWASAWWTGQEEIYLRAGEEGNKVGWFRPDGAELKIDGQRIDAESDPLDTHVPCCYPTKFQSTGLYFPTAGCWEITAKAADSEIMFLVWVAP
ncbi:MAG: hypothetical protein KDJ65_36925 [Anaerolineae bacterium]|nr:hypothetical protein [Anaerolineae bacterium]